MFPDPTSFGLVPLWHFLLGNFCWLTRKKDARKKKENIEEKKENCKEIGGNVNLKGERYKNGQRTLFFFFFFFFACHFLKPLKFVGVYQNGNFYRKKSAGKNDFAPPGKYSSYASVQGLELGVAPQVFSSNICSDQWLYVTGFIGLIIQRLHNPVRQTFPHGIQHVFIVIQWTMTHSSLNHNEICCILYENASLKVRSYYTAITGVLNLPFMWCDCFFLCTHQWNVELNR